MSGDGKRSVAEWPKLPRPSSTLPVDGRLVALDAATGKMLWDISLANETGPSEATSQLKDDKALAGMTAMGSTGAGVNMAPLLVNGKVIVGITGVGFGLHLE